MNQTSIFDPPISRRTDPQTSRNAEVRFTLTNRALRQRQVLSMVNRYPDCTSGEYSRAMIKLYPELPIRTAVESPHKRLADLETKGLVVKSGKRMCRDSRYECHTYACTQLGKDALRASGEGDE